MTDYKDFHEILEAMNKIADNTEFSDDSRLTELFKLTVAADRDRLKVAKEQLAVTEKSYQHWSSKVDTTKKLFCSAENELEKIRQINEQLKNGVMSSCNNPNDIEEIKACILKDKELLRRYKEVTGVHFSFNSPHPSVAGYVAVKGTASSGSKLRPFVFSYKSIPQLQEDLWKKIDETTKDDSSQY